MNTKMLWQDIKRNKAVTSTLFLFMILATLLVAAASSMTVELIGSVKTLFDNSKAPHFVQMHSGEFNQTLIDDFSAANELVTSQQTVEMLGVPGKNIVLGEGNVTEANSVMEIAFVTQNEKFDYLLNLSGEKGAVTKGQVGVPVYHMQKNNLQEGDKIQIDCGGTALELTISCFIRDVQMNPSIVTSKRFLVSSEDFHTIKNAVGTSEYLIEFLLSDMAHIGAFEQQYATSALPQSDTAITYSLYQMVNALSDGMVIGIILLIGVLLICISMLCLRYVILGALEEDIREIGIMKAIGLSVRDIRKVYTAKYLILAAIAGAVGYLLSFPLQTILLKNIALYMGTAEKTIWSYLVPLIGVLAVFLLIFIAVRVVLRRLKELSVVQSLSLGIESSTDKSRKPLSLRKTPVKNVNAIMGVGAIWLNLKAYLLLGFIYVVCVFLAITPVNLYSTMTAPEFVTYMGAGMSDMRMDLQSANPQNEYKKIAAYLESDTDISRYTSFVTGTFTARNSEGEFVTIKVETGDFSVFPVNYQSGKAPGNEDEISLSTMNAEELGKGIGDTLTVIVDGQERNMTVCGLYQDVTNGGKTAKALLPVEEDNILWYVINMDVNSNVNIEMKKSEYTELFSEARTLDMNDYLKQTLGAVTSQVRLAAVCAVLISALISVLVTTMFFRMVLAKERSQIGIMSCLGFSKRDFMVQYAVRALLVFLAAIILGTLAVFGIGQSITGLVFSVMGAGEIEFIVNPIVSYLFCPALLICCILFTTCLCSRSFGKKLNMKNITE